MNYIVNSCHVVTVILEEVSPKMGTESLPEMYCIGFQYVGWNNSENSLSPNLNSVTFSKRKKKIEFAVCANKMKWKTKRGAKQVAPCLSLMPVH